MISIEQVNIFLALIGLVGITLVGYGVFALGSSQVNKKAEWVSSITDYVNVNGKAVLKHRDTKGRFIKK